MSADPTPTEQEIAEAQRTAEEIARRLYVAGSPEHPVCSECDESWGTHDPDGCWVTNYVIPTTREAVTALLARERERTEDVVVARHAEWAAQERERNTQALAAERAARERERDRIEDEVDAWHAAWVAHVELLEAEGRHLDGLLTREREEHHSTYCETCYVMGSGRDRAEQALATERARAERYAAALHSAAKALNVCIIGAGGSAARQAAEMAHVTVTDALTPAAETCAGCARHPEDCACPEPNAPRSADGEGKAQHDREHLTPVWGCPACLTPDAPPASATEQADEGRVSALAPERREGVATTGVPPIKGTISGLSGYLVVPKTLPDAPTEGRG